MLMLEARMTYIAQRRQTVDKLNKEMEQKLIEVVFFFKSCVEINTIEPNIIEDCVWYREQGIITWFLWFCAGEIIILKQIAHAHLLLLDVCSSVMSWKVDQLKNWLVVTLTHSLKKCLADYVLESKTFPHVLLHATFRLGNALSSSQNVYSVLPSRGSTTLLHFYTGPETPLLRPPLISGRDFLSRFLSSPFSSLFYAHRHAGWGHSERVNRCRLIRPRLSDIAQLMYLMWSLFSSNKRIKN